jgi:hypothetical protein
MSSTTTTIRHEAEVHLQFGELKPLIEWVKEHCTNNWNYEIIDYPGRGEGIYKFNFYSEEDYFKFVMWKQ